MVCVNYLTGAHAHAGSSSTLVRRNAAEAIAALMQGQAQLSAQGSQAKPGILLAACCRAEACCPEEGRLCPWHLQGAQQHIRHSVASPPAEGLELVPDLLALEALAELLIFQSGGQEDVQVSPKSFHLRSRACTSASISGI